MSGSYELVDGTSCSAPYWAGLIALLNDGLFKHGKQPLGFINPTLYSIYNSNPQAFNDIVGGTNACTEKCCAKYGYPVVAGYVVFFQFANHSLSPIHSFFFFFSFLDGMLPLAWGLPTTLHSIRPSLGLLLLNKHQLSSSFPAL